MVSAGGPAEMRQRSEFGAGELAYICWTGHQEGTSQEEGSTSLVQIAYELVATLHSAPRDACQTEVHTGMRTE